MRMIGYPVGLQVVQPDGMLQPEPAALVDGVTMREGEVWDHTVMRLNTKRANILRNIRNNIRRQLPQFSTHAENSEHVAIVGGGWSLTETFEELRALYHDGVKIIALNGAARWLMERNLRPSMHIMLDARPENVEFLEPAIPRCKYFLASQCDGAMFDAAAGRDVTLFHALGEGNDAEHRRLNDFYNRRWIRVPTGGTVGVTSIMLVRLLGYRYQHLFGMDSCYEPAAGRHHAFPQALNDGEGTATFRIADREFVCSSWQASQARNFMDMIAVNGETVELEIHGDGLLAHLLKHGAAMPEAVAKEA